MSMFIALFTAVALFLITPASAAQGANAAQAASPAQGVGPGKRAGLAEGVDPDIAKQPWAVWDSKDKPVRGGILRLAVPLYIGKMNPNHWPVLDWVSMGYFHEKLAYTDGQYNPTVPWLAKSIKYENPTTILMTLRKGVQFHDGSEMTAETIKYQIDWIRDPKNGAWSASYLASISSVDVIDKYTLRWKLKEPWAGFMGTIANVPGYVLSMKALKADSEKYDSTPVGTGPYILEDASPGNYLKFKRNPNWWFAKASGHPDMPYFDGILVSVIPDPQVRLANLRAGKIDILDLDKSQYAQVKNDPDIAVYKQPLNWVSGLRFNTTKGVFKDIRLRQAVSMAIDRRAIVAGTQFGLGRIASGLFPEDHWAHNPNLQPVAYNPTKAKELLAAAGYPNGLTIKGYYTNTTAGQGLAEAIKNMLAKIGIDWQVELLAPVAATARMKELDYDLAQGGWAWMFDPDLVVTGLYHPDGGFNFGHVKNDTINKLIEAGRKEVDFKKRQKIYWDMEKVIYDQYIDVFLFWEETATARRKSLAGWNQDEFLKWRETYAWTHPLWFNDKP